MKGVEKMTSYCRRGTFYTVSPAKIKRNAALTACTLHSLSRVDFIISRPNIGNCKTNIKKLKKVLVNRWPKQEHE